MRKLFCFAMCAANLVTPCASFSQTPPPNDNFTNSITLTGNDVTFSGSLAGATIEGSQESLTFSSQGEGAPTGSIWWNWTATADTTLTLQILNTSPGDMIPQNYNTYGIAVYLGTNSSLPNGFALPALGYLGLGVAPMPLSFSMPVVAGSNYQMQLVGKNPPGTATVRLVATNTPIIVRQPRSQTVSTNDCATFYVVYAGLNQASNTFQWQFNGNNLSGETAPILSLTNIDGSQAGAYTVIVGNTAGFTVSDPAILKVSQLNYPVTLAPLGIASNAFVFSVTGELGRSYTLQSSTNLVNWAVEANFPMNPYYEPDDTTWVFHEINSPVQVGVPVTNLTAGKFFRVAPYSISQPDASVCINNLRQIRIAKLLWRLGQNEYSVAIPALADLLPYFPHQIAPYCPDDSSFNYDTSYAANDGNTAPVCLILPFSHVLVDPVEP